MPSFTCVVTTTAVSLLRLITNYSFIKITLVIKKPENAKRKKARKGKISEKKKHQEKTLMNLFNKKVVTEDQTLRQEEPEKEFEEEEAEEERCKADECKIDNCQDDDIQWVLCDVCHSWWHLFCLDLSTMPKKFTCPKC